MLVIAIKQIFIILLCAISAILTRKFLNKDSLIKDILVLLITSITAFWTTELINIVDKYYSSPKVVVDTQLAMNRIKLEINVKRKISSFTLSYPVNGVVTNVQNLNSINDANTPTIRVIGGSKSGTLSNTLEILITDIRPDVHLSYTIFYEPYKSNLAFEVNGMDRYHYSYVWKHNGEEYYKDYWSNVTDDSKSSKPDLIILDASFSNKAPTLEEIKKDYEEGPPKRDLK